MKLFAAALGICLLGPVADPAPDPAAGPGGAARSVGYDGRVQALDVPPLAPGERGELSLVVLDPVERGVPLRVWLEDGEVSLPENRLGWRDVVDAQAAQLRLRAVFVAPSEPGDYEVKGQVTYSTCGPRWCRAKHAALLWLIRVEAPAPE